jgi:hypothetical protein
LVWAIALSVPKVVRRPECGIKQISSHTFILYSIKPNGGDREAEKLIQDEKTSTQFLPSTVPVPGGAPEFACVGRKG